MKKTPLQLLFIIATYFLQAVFSDTIKQQTITVNFYQNQNNYVLDSTLLNLQFSTDLPTITTDILQNAIDIKLKNLVNNVDFTWQVITKVSNSLFQIKINYKTSIYVKQLYLYFINPYAIHDQNSNYLSLDSYTISVSVGPVVFFESYQNSEIDVMKLILFIVICIFCGLYFIIYTFRYLKEGLNLFWAFVDLIQLYNLFLFLDTNHFENVSKLLKQCNILNFWYIDFINKYQNTSFMQHAIENPSTSAITNLPYPFIQNQYTSYFILNSFFPLFIVGTGILLMLTSLIVCPQSRFRIQGVLRNLAQFSLLIRGTLISCCQIFISAFLFFKNFTGVINIVTCIVTIVFYTSSILAFSYVLNIGQSIPLAEQQTKDKYGSLYEGLILKAVLKRNFNIFFMLRKIIMAIFIIFLDNKQMLQMIFVLVVQIIFMGLISSKLPYEYGKNNVWMVTSEFFLSGFLLLMSAWVVFDYLGKRATETQSKATTTDRITYFR
ncbi:transmembrane protein, putative (macronuclear) [Tetrahymena thermophila SB210]|uniref:Transmembrane protein, putative n=1 Tax=Tetrahymena thermophila (strain SB210) TaxID=312017 RepID=Q24FX1_TETTS|nr:transmembrane protein, putative [Tetrahymena thermophila SB210]EAS06639.2 transmembrane protein, putative [Tetrahymena thermophila SB210]|eukprot:XP_001026884.2 transmembrane protein, putative [Tetrahymena thermophila SB210]